MTPSSETLKPGRRMTHVPPKHNNIAQLHTVKAPPPPKVHAPNTALLASFVIINM
jgi:hypothetical protein